MTHPPDHSMPSLSMFSDILMELSKKARQDPTTEARRRLKFVNTSILPHQEVEQGMLDYLKANLTQEEFIKTKNKIEDLNQESRLCELLLDVIAHTESQLDRHVAMFDDLLATIHKVKEMEDDGTNFKEQAIDKCSLLIYDSFAVLRSMRKKVVELAKTYHVPYFYDTEESTIRLRSSLLTTYKNLCIVIEDFSVLSEALWFVRNYNYFGDEDNDKPVPGGTQPALAYDGTASPIYQSQLADGATLQSASSSDNNYMSIFF